MNGRGQVNLTGSNSYSGATYVQQGLLTFDNPNAVGSSTLTFIGPGTLRTLFSGTLGNNVRNVPGPMKARVLDPTAFGYRR